MQNLRGNDDNDIAEYTNIISNCKLDDALKVNDIVVFLHETVLVRNQISMTYLKSILMN